MSRLPRLAAVILPVLGLAGLWGMSDHTYYQGTDWEVPIEGYDPRDYLRGHYVEFAYDWPGIDATRASGGSRALTDLCLSGDAPVIRQVRAIGADTPCAHRLRAEPSDVYSALGLIRGRLYVGQDRALALEEALRGRDQRGIVTIRQRDDGSFTPIAIRFRPLTPAEIAERDAQDAQDAQRAEDMRPPPAIMSN